MVRISTGKTASAPTAKAARSKGKSAPSGATSGGVVKAPPLSRRRAQFLVVLAVVLVLGWTAQAAWRSAGPIVASRERYLLRAAGVTTNDPPEWIVADVRSQVIHASGLDGRLSILDPEFVETIKQAFTLHPWVQSVKRIEKKFPPAVHVELTYRRPVAVVETPLGDSRQLLPVDDGGRRLPTEDVPLIRREYLPRITGIVGQPPLGQRWEDPRVAGAVDLATLLAGVWEAMHLTEIYPSARPEVQGDRQFFVYEIVTRGGTRIIWGAAPRAQAPGEAEFIVKLERLRRCVEQYGPLDSPGTVNVRGELEVKPRMVKKPEAAGEAGTVVK